MRGSIGAPMVFGIVLVLLGVALLLNNLGITTISIGEIVETYWPIVLVALGLSAVLRPREGERVRDERAVDERAVDERAGDEGAQRSAPPEPHRAAGPNIFFYVVRF